MLYQIEFEHKPDHTISSIIIIKVSNRMSSYSEQNRTVYENKIETWTDEKGSETNGSDKKETK